MDKNLYIIRHCQAEGQPPQASLTEKGFEQALALTEFFSTIQIDRIISSPFLRAIQTIQPFAQKTNLKIEEDERLAERILSKDPIPNWLEIYKETYQDLDLKFSGGESTREATNRALSLIHEIQKSPEENMILVSHGNLISLLISNLFDEVNGFKLWENLSNPDVYHLQFNNEEQHFKRIWESN
ncbi:histidine phosphatase family protein [Bacillus niameyensis]|uniref:histidine phosphatase family protein n=1 Tax=Bacillus niameyensis TaxID=1522308 RepID=UPI000782660F|nr:histidine phosphatase family protein [Bacillus niameyensis]